MFDFVNILLYYKSIAIDNGNQRKGCQDRIVQQVLCGLMGREEGLAPTRRRLLVDMYDLIHIDCRNLSVR